MKKLIKNGLVVNDRECIKADVLIEGEVIKAVSPEITAEQGVEVMDASGKLLLPGAVDVHTHMDLDAGAHRSCDTFYTGTVAAAFGGTTTIVDHMAFGPKGCLPRHQVREYHRLADGEACVDYSFHGVLQERVDEQVLSEMKELSEEEGITSFKLYLTYDKMLSDRDVFAVLEEAKKDDILIAVHCENDGIISCLRDKFGKENRLSAAWHPKSRPAMAEAEAVNRMLYMAACADEAPLYIVHLSSEAGLNEVIRARAGGQKHFGVETCPQYLLLDDSLYDDPVEGLKAIMSPPLRKEADREALWKALSEGILDVVATDHCPFTFKVQKQSGAEDFRKCPNGAPGVQERLLLLFSEGCKKGRLSLPALAGYLCANPARIFGLYPKKGVIQPESDADLVILDPEGQTIVNSEYIRGNSDYSCYEGFKLAGRIETVFLRGSVIVEDGRFSGKKGGGRYLKRGISSLCR